MRGQAFVIFQDEDAAESAQQALRGFVFFGKPMRVNYAKKQSDVTAKMRGTFEESEKARREQRRVKELSNLFCDYHLYRGEIYQDEKEVDR